MQGRTGGLHSTPLGIEVSVTAAAISEETFHSAYRKPVLSEVLGSATFYRYRLRYLGAATLREAYIGFYVDPDVGNAIDDYVGSDSSLGLAFAYNADNFDEGGYADQLPAVGFDFVRGLRAAAGDSVDNDRDGIVDEEGERMAMTSFVRYGSGGGAQGSVFSADDACRYLQGTWKNGSPITVGLDGFNGSEATTFMYSGNPPGYWSMDDPDGSGESFPAVDQNFLMSMGPFDMEPGEEQDFVLAILWTKAGDRLDAVRQLKAADNTVQTAVDSGLLDPSRAWLDVSVAAPPSESPASGAFELGRNHPNPFRGETTIVYVVPAEMHVRLGVYDLLGRKVGLLVDGRRGAGRHEALFDAAALPAGVLFVRMETPFGTVTRPIVVAH